MGVYLNNFIITIDGPSGSGKERIAKYIAKKYCFYHLDSGILYRRLSSLILKNDVNIKSKKEFSNMNFLFKPDMTTSNIY